MFKKPSHQRPHVRLVLSATNPEIIAAACLAFPRPAIIAHDKRHPLNANTIDYTLATIDNLEEARDAIHWLERESAFTHDTTLCILDTDLLGPATDTQVASFIHDLRNATINVVCGLDAGSTTALARALRDALRTLDLVYLNNRIMTVRSLDGHTVYEPFSARQHTAYRAPRPDTPADPPPNTGPPPTHQPAIDTPHAANATTPPDTPPNLQPASNLPEDAYPNGIIPGSRADLERLYDILVTLKPSNLNLEAYLFKSGIWKRNTDGTTPEYPVAQSPDSVRELCDIIRNRIELARLDRG